MKDTRKYTEWAVKFACVVLAPIGTYFTINDNLMRFIASALEAVGAYLAVEFLSNFTPPRAFAIAYFSSFLDPIMYAVNGGTGSISYAKNGQPVTLALPSSARLLVVLPKNLDLVDKSNPQGLYTVLEDVQKKYVSGQLSLDPKQKAFGVYLDVSDPQQPQIVDVPNNLFALRSLVVREAGSEKQAKELMRDYVAQLQKSLRQQPDEFQERVEVREAH
jgi:hypothetical protein